MRLTLLDAEDHVKLQKINQRSSYSCGEGLYCQRSARADFSEIFVVALLSTFSTVSAPSRYPRRTPGCPLLGLELTYAGAGPEVCL